MKTKIKNLMNEALTLHQKGDVFAAEKLYLQILETTPDNSDALNLLGLIQTQSQNFEQAISYFTKAIEIRPSSYYYENIGTAYFKLNDYDNAIISHKKALELEPDSFDNMFNLALAYKNNNDYDNAIMTYEKAILIKPKLPDTYFNLGNIYEKMNDTKKALVYYEKAHEYNISYDWIDYFLGISNLKIKNFKDGWKHFEGRPSKQFAIVTQEQVYKEKITQKPLWQGEPLQDKTLFVYYDSALGDTLMFVRYIPLLKKVCKKLIFKPQSCFIDLFKENNFGAEIIDNRTLPDDVDFDVHTPLVSAPYLLGLNSENDIPLSEGYLSANKELAEIFKSKYFNTDKFKIGIKWMGCPNYDRDRILPIEKFNELFDLPNTQFYSLQKGEGSEEFDKIPQKYNVIDLSDTFETFSDTAAAIENLDLVICNDTSVAHLAGAMGKKCWILLPFVPNWRWHDDVSYCPWYKNVKLFKQPELSNWHEVFDRVHIALKEILK